MSKEYLGWVSTEYLGWVSTEYLGWMSTKCLGWVSTENLRWGNNLFFILNLGMISILRQTCIFLIFLNFSELVLCLLFLFFRKEAMSLQLLDRLALFWIAIRVLVCKWGFLVCKWGVLACY